MTRRIAFWLGEEGVRGRAPFPAGGGGEADAPSLSGLVFLFLADDQRADGSAGWRRGRKVLREVEAKLAATPGITYQVRALPGRDGRALRKPRKACGRAGRCGARPTAWTFPSRWPACGLGSTAMWPRSGWAARS